MEENYKLAKWLAGEMTPEELAAFEAEPDFAVYHKIKNYTAALAAPDFDEQKTLSAVLNAPKKEIKTLSLTQNWFFRIAAVLVIGLGLFLTTQFFGTSTELAEDGTQVTFLLPDHSEVVLNSGSEIEYKKWNWNNNRTLALKGEAYFKVAKGKTFDVNTNLGKVTVLGTQFNVKQRDNRFQVNCYEGKVKVTYNQTETIITKGMSVAFENGKPIAIPDNVNQQPEWRQNELAFYQADLKSILSEFERHFNVTLVLRSTPSNQLFTGTIPAKDIDVALQILSESYHLKAIKPIKTDKSGKNKFILTTVDAHQ